MKIPLFYSDLFIEKNVGSTSEREELLNIILDLESKIKNKHKPLSKEDFASSYSSQTSLCVDGNMRIDFFDNITNDVSLQFEWLSDAIEKIVDDAINNYVLLDDTYKSWVEKTEMSKQTLGMWIGIKQPKQRVTLHEHKRSMLSFIYYLKATDSGDIIFRNPSNTMAECNVLSPFVRPLSHPPEDGDLILFPSWIPHEVEVGLSDKKRITVAGDIDLDSNNIRNEKII